MSPSYPLCVGVWSLLLRPLVLQEYPGKSSTTFWINDSLMYNSFSTFEGKYLMSNCNLVKDFNTSRKTQNVCTSRLIKNYQYEQ